MSITAGTYAYWYKINTTMIIMMMMEHQVRKILRLNHGLPLGSGSTAYISSSAPYHITVHMYVGLVCDSVCIRILCAHVYVCICM